MALDSVLAELFQTTCLLCDGPAPDGRFCNGGHRLLGVTDSACGWCGEILSQPAEQCGRCDGGTKYPLAGRSLFRLNDDARTLLHRIKYDSLSGLFELFLPALREWHPWDDIKDFVLVPVPLHPNRYWKRGFNLSEKIARVLGEAWGIPLSYGLTKQRESAKQAQLNREERQKNLQGSFVWRGETHHKVILVDDVFTTGATFLACATALGGETEEVRTATAFRTPLHNIITT